MHMVRSFVYRILVIPFGAMAGLAVSPSLSAAIGAASLCAAAGVCLATHRNRALRGKLSVNQQGVDGLTEHLAPIMPGWQPSL